MNKRLGWMDEMEMEALIEWAFVRDLGIDGTPTKSHEDPLDDIYHGNADFYIELANDWLQSNGYAQFIVSDVSWGSDTLLWEVWEQ